MATDYSIIEEELKQQKAQLERQLHMQQVHRLRRKQADLAQFVVQRKQIENLEKRIVEIEPTVSKLYCHQAYLKDNQVKGYLVYLLKMKDFFSREVAAKEEMVAQKDAKIKQLTRELCVVNNELAKKIRNCPVVSPEFKRLENMSNRMNEMNKRISTMRQENKDIMDNIIIMRKFQKQFKVFETDFRRKIDKLKGRAQDLLEKAVLTYEEKEEFMMKTRIYEERSAQDSRRTAINQNALDLCLWKTEKNEDFEEKQNNLRIDMRIAEASEMVEKGITGLEARMNKTQHLQTAIVNAAGESTPEKMEELFKVGEDCTNMMFSYLDELLKEINSLQVKTQKVRKENKLLTKNMSSRDKKLRKDIKIKKDKAKVELDKANKATEATEEARAELNSMLGVVKSLYIRCCPDDASSLDKTPIDDSNVTDYLQKMEKQILDYLICLEYLRTMEAEKKEKTLVLEAETDEEDDVEAEKTEQRSQIKPRAILSDRELSAHLEGDSEEEFLDFEELNEMAVTTLARIQLENEDDSDDTH